LLKTGSERPRCNCECSTQLLATLLKSVGNADRRIQTLLVQISGGGSGHEPAREWRDPLKRTCFVEPPACDISRLTTCELCADAGFVGEGLLTAAICGNVFASPNVGQIRQAVEQVANDKGTLAVVMRYTGDVLLFGLAKEQQAVTNPERPFRLTVVGDDVAVGRSQGRLVGRRGLAGTVLVYKLASALAETGADLEDVHALAEYAATRVGTMGAGLDHCRAFF
jgi:dihydroxyacetone kinase